MFSLVLICIYLAGVVLCNHPKIERVSDVCEPDTSPRNLGLSVWIRYKDARGVAMALPSSRITVYATYHSCGNDKPVSTYTLSSDGWFNGTVSNFPYSGVWDTALYVKVEMANDRIRTVSGSNWTLIESYTMDTGRVSIGFFDNQATIHEILVGFIDPVTAYIVMNEASLAVTDYLLYVPVSVAVWVLGSQCKGAAVYNWVERVVCVGYVNHWDTMVYAHEYAHHVWNIASGGRQPPLGNNTDHHLCPETPILPGLALVEGYADALALAATSLDGVWVPDNFGYCDLETNCKGGFNIQTSESRIASALYDLHDYHIDNNNGDIRCGAMDHNDTVWLPFHGQAIFLFPLTRGVTILDANQYLTYVLMNNEISQEILNLMKEAFKLNYW